jgi:hypothetical protein
VLHTRTGWGRAAQPLGGALAAACILCAFGRSYSGQLSNLLTYILILTAFWLLRSTWRAYGLYWGGDVRLEIRPQPCRLGDALTVTVGCGERASPPERVELVLRCRQVWGVSGGEEDTPFWRESKVLHEGVLKVTEADRLPAPGSDIELTLRLPVAPPTAALRRNASVHWELDLRVATPDLHFVERFMLEMEAEHDAA